MFFLLTISNENSSAENIIFTEAFLLSCGKSHRSGMLNADYMYTDTMNNMVSQLMLLFKSAHSFSRALIFRKQ